MDSSPKVLRTVSPIDGEVYAERPLAGEAEVRAALRTARQVQAGWREVPLSQRARRLEALVEVLVGWRGELAEEICRQMGRPIAQAPEEIDTFAERARTMIALGPEALADIRLEPAAGLERFIAREPLGVVLVVAPWNYPYLTSVNAVIPALLAGNAVLLKTSAQTPLCAERYSLAAREAGLPAGLLSHLHLDHRQVARLVADPAVAQVAFTGSVEGGRAVVRAAARRFLAPNLELGGKSPAYVRADAELEPTVASLVAGATYNAGQSCAAVKRIYVHCDLARQFVEAFRAEILRACKLGNPLEPATTLGPVVSAKAASRIRAQVQAALAAGARPLIDEAGYQAARPATAYLAPQVLVGVDHSMAVMREETFGPVVGIMEVASDEEAVFLMNDSRYGLTASVYTADRREALAIGHRLEVGTVYQNQCDYLDPELAWVGVKDSGRGVSLSGLGYASLTRPKSYYLQDG